MHDLDGVVGIFLTFELHEAIPLMLIGDLIPGDMNIDNWPTLCEQFPKQTLVYFGVDVTRIHCGFLVALVERGDHRHGSYNINMNE